MKSELGRRKEIRLPSSALQPSSDELLGEPGCGSASQDLIIRTEN
jgi:hypothetical protein